MPRLLLEKRTAQADFRLLAASRGEVVVREECPDGQLYLLHRGTWHFAKDGAKTEILSPHEAAYSAPSEPCRRTAETDLVAFGVQFRPSRTAWQSPRLTLPWDLRRQLHRLLHAFLTHDEALEDETALLLAEPSEGPASHSPRWLDTVRSLLHEGEPGDQSLRALADSIDLSPSHLSSAFRRATGQSLATYRSRVRLGRALKMAADRPIGEAAVEAGFYDVAHFHRTCKRELGLTPAQLVTLPSRKIANLYKTCA